MSWPPSVCSVEAMKQTISRGLAIRFAITLAFVFVAGLALGAAFWPRSDSQLPDGFLVRHTDGVTYVCSTRPIYCTGNDDQVYGGGSDTRGSG